MDKLVNDFSLLETGALIISLFFSSFYFYFYFYFYLYLFYLFFLFLFYSFEHVFGLPRKKLMQEKKGN